MNFLEVCGLALLFTMAFGLVVAVCSLYDLYKDDIKRRFRYKYRFSKPPKAKCYCKDCKHHDPDGRCCKDMGYKYTKDDWFCAYASPIKESK